MIVKCVITTEGRVESCRIIKPLPHMEQAVLVWLQSSKYKPVTFQGQPQSGQLRLQLQAEHGRSSGYAARTHSRLTARITEEQSTNHAIHSH